MSNLATHPFVPCQHRPSTPATCLQCSQPAADPIHDWLSPITPEEMVQLPNLLIDTDAVEQHEEILAGLANERYHSRVADASGRAVQWTYNGNGTMEVRR